MSAPWTEAHRVEALRRTYEIAAEIVGDQPTRAAVLSHLNPLDPLPLQTWRNLLANAAGFDHARINREVRRVRGLAEGRLVREVTWHVRMIAGNLSCAMEEDSARDLWRHALTTQGVVVRVTRIRSAP